MRLALLGGLMVSAGVISMGIAAGAEQKQPPQATLAGYWEGRIDLGRTLQRIVLRSPSGPDSATVDLPDSNQLRLAVQGLSIDAGRIRFELQTRQGKAAFSGSAGDGAITGDFRQSDTAGSFYLVRTLEPDVAAYRRLAGSYEIAPGRFIDVGPSSSADNRLAFVDSATRRTSVLY